MALVAVLGALWRAGLATAEETPKMAPPAPPATAPAPASAYLVTDFGAVGDGKTLNTAALQKAVDTCAAAGGGRVVVPAGTFVSGPVFLKSNIELHLSAGAVLQGSRNFKDYPPVDVEVRGLRINEFLASLVTAVGATNVAVTGRGVLDGQGAPWWAEIDAGRGGRRPVTLYFCNCERVLIEGVQVMNSPAWTILPLLCRNVTIQGVTIKNPWKPYHNCDGIDIHACSNVRVANCFIDTGDDGICLKSLPDWFISANGTGKVDYAQPRIPCENVVIENCVVEHGHSGVGIWAEVLGGMRNVTVSNCVFDGTRTGIRIARYPWPGGFVRDVRVSGVVMRRVEAVIELSSFYDPKKVEPGPGREDTPEFRNIHFSNITATQARFACEAYGLPQRPLRDISFSNLRIEADKGFDLRDAEDVLFDNVEVTCPGPALLATDVRRLELRRFLAPAALAGAAAVQFAGVQDAWVRGCRATAGTDVFLGLVGDANRGLVVEGNDLTRAAQAQAAVAPAPTWSFSSYAFSGSSMWRSSGHQNPFLPVTPAVWATIQREWPAARRQFIHGVHRLESGARPDITLPAGDRREIYIIEAWQVVERLIIAEDGELLQKTTDPEFKAWRF